MNLLVRRVLTHSLRPSSAFTFGTYSALRCMRSSPRFQSSPEGNKRRRVGYSPSRSFSNSDSKMSPLLVQELGTDVAAPTTLELVPVEATLRRLLLDVADYIKENPSSEAGSQVKLPPDLAKQDLVLRFTGGWVRDKLLGVPSHDIDVAINKMTGEQFGLRMKEYLEIPGNPEKYGLEGVASTEKQSQSAGSTDKSKVVGGLHKIEANPEKSKHLETITTRILGLDIDLVNLRKETYSDDSRNPQIEFGSPEEDALRRDATVNAMFYNINTEKIEDFTGHGHRDMRDKIIRTPLPPYQTFEDDPLRVLRLIRFASRLGYTIDKAALGAMRETGIKDALRRKISRERVGIELEKALKGPDPHEALRLIFDLDLYLIIFSDPTVPEQSHYAPDTKGWQVLIDYLKETITDGGTITEVTMRDREEEYLAWQLAAFVPYRDAPQPEPPSAKKKMPPPVAASIAREGIKAANKITDVVTASVRNQADISDLVQKVWDQKRRPAKVLEGEDACARDVLGMAIRRWDKTWRAQIVYSMLVEIADGVGGGDDQISYTERKYATFLQHLQSLDILDAYEFKPIIDGVGLAKALDTRPGPWMTDALKVVMAWQLRHPGLTDPTDAIEEVKQKRGELTSSLVRHFLKLTIRPLFAKTKPRTITDQGREVTGPVLPAKLSSQSMDEKASKPWKTADLAYSLKLLKWSVASLDGKLVEELWPLLIPPILTLIDDWEVQYKSMGAQLLTKVLDVTPPVLLQRTGLGAVFEGALMPCLTYLPTLTEEEESMELLQAVYPAFLTLAKTRYPISETSTRAEVQQERVQFLDTIVRKGVLFTYEYCPTYPHILAVVFVHLTSLLTELGIESVKHLKHILPMLTEVLSKPLLAASTSEHVTLLAAVQALQATVLNGWPRIGEYRGEILKGVTLCWLSLESIQTNERLRAELRRTIDMLHAALPEEKQEPFKQECRRLVDVEERLQGLF